MSRRASLASILVLIAVAILGAGCATNPVSGKREFTLVSSGQEEQIGRDGYQAVVAEYGLYDDPALQAYVDSVGKKLARTSHLPNLAWRFTVVDDPAVNAFAMPGGYIYITRGILAHLNSEAQLAGVLGHEMGHVTAKHSSARITQQQLAGLGLGIASLVSEGFQRYGQAAQTALGLLFLKYGRDDENQADELGVDYAAKSGYDPREIPSTYAMLKRVSEKSGQRLPSFLSTHPDPGDREVHTTALANAAAAGKSGLQIRERYYLERQDGVVFGADPRHGYFEAEHYYHPTLGFQMSFPTGWKTQDTRSSVMAAKPDERAVMQLTLVANTSLSPAGFVAELERAGRITGSRGGSETIGGYSAWVGQLAVTGQNNTPLVYAAAYIRKSADQMFQILGRTASAGDADEARILGAARSFGALTDSRRLQPRPARVDVVSVRQAGEFGTVVPGFGPQGLGLEDTAILNNAFLDQTVRAGELLKIVTPATLK